MLKTMSDKEFIKCLDSIMETEAHIEFLNEQLSSKSAHLTEETRVKYKKQLKYDKSKLCKLNKKVNIDIIRREEIKNERV